MKSFTAIGPIGVAIRGDEIYQYYKNENSFLVKEKFKRKIRVFVSPENVENTLEKIREIKDFEGLQKVEDVVYGVTNPKKACMISFLFDGKKEEREKLKSVLKLIPEVIGIEEEISDCRKQEYFLSKTEDFNFSKRFGYYLKTKLSLDEKESNLIELSQEFPKTRKEIDEQLRELEKSLCLFTVDYETFNDEIVIATARSTDGFSKTLIVNENQSLSEDFKRILGPHGIEIEVVPDEKSLIKKVYEYRKRADIEIVHGSSILEKQKDREEFPSTKGRPTDKFDVKIYYRFVPSIQVVSSEGIIPSEDSLYVCKFLHPEIRSLEDMLEFFLGNKEILKKTDYKKFGIYKKIKSPSDVENFKKEVIDTVLHNSQDALAHLKLSEYLLFDLGFLVLPMLYAVDIKNVFGKIMEDGGAAILTSEFIQNKIFPKMTKSYTNLNKSKERIIKSYEKIFTKNYGKKIEGKWIYPFFGFAPKIIMENQEVFGPYISSVIEKMLKFKERIEVFGVDERSGKNITFDPYSFAINCVSACLYFGRKSFTDENISNKLLEIFIKIYKNLNEELKGCKIIYSSPFKSRIFISDFQEEFIQGLNEHKTLLSGYNKHKDVFIPLSKNQALATESGRIIKIGWRGASKYDPIVVREAEKKIIENFVKYGLEKASSTFHEEIEKIENLVYPTKFYKISAKLSKRPEEYKKKTFKSNLLEEVYNQYRKKFNRELRGFIDFYFTKPEIDFSDEPESKIDGRAYVEYLKYRLRPLLKFFKTEISKENNKLTNYMNM